MGKAKDEWEALLKQKEIYDAAKALAERNGWPRLTQYFISHTDESYLEKIPESFVSLFTPEFHPDTCPEIPFLRARYDLMPHLIEHGLSGYYLSFGYGPKWFAVGKTGIESIRRLMDEFHLQMPIFAGHISNEALYDLPARRYYLWQQQNMELNTVTPSTIESIRCLSRG